MKTNRTSIRRFALIVGTIWMTSQGAAQADVAKPASQSADQVKTVSAEQLRVMLASTSCTRVGNRMVC